MNDPVLGSSLPRGAGLQDVADELDGGRFAQRPDLEEEAVEKGAVELVVTLFGCAGKIERSVGEAAPDDLDRGLSAKGEVAVAEGARASASVRLSAITRSNRTPSVPLRPRVKAMTCPTMASYGGTDVSSGAVLRSS